MPGVLSLLFTVIAFGNDQSGSRRNVVRALFLILFYPAALVSFLYSLCRKGDSGVS